MMFPEAGFKGVLLVIHGPKTFFMSSYMVRILPQSAESRMILQRLSQSSFALRRRIRFASFLDFLNAASEFPE